VKATVRPFIKAQVRNTEIDVLKQIVEKSVSAAHNLSSIRIPDNRAEDNQR
jgi:hypothetical protein